jgi:4-nitrophenyl phosphatase
MDGVLWLGDTPLPGLVEFFDFLRRRSIPFILATNNASKTPHQYTEKLAGFGVAVKPEEILNSSLAAAAYLKREFASGAPIHLLGMDGLYEAVAAAGFTIVPDASRPVEAVVAGADFKLTYDKLKYAALLIQRGARFIGTNPDLTYPFVEGLAPGAGAILAALEATTGVAPIIIGKPKPFMFEVAMEMMGSTPNQTAMLGDRLETDILGGQQAGVTTILLTTGIDNEATIPQKGIAPDLVLHSLAEVVAALG